MSRRLAQLNTKNSTLNTKKSKLFIKKHYISIVKTNVTYHPDHLGSSSFVTNVSGIAIQELRYMPYGEILTNKRSTGSNYNTPYKFSAKEKDAETGFNYFGARYYVDYMYVWLSVDPMSDKYPHQSPYMYCSGNPVRLIDPNGMDWEDAEGNKIKDHSKIKVYIFYDPRGEGKGFAKQSKAMYSQLEAKYGKGSVAMSNVTTTDEFKQDWGDMASPDIREVNLNYHGNNQTVMLNSDKKEYITATGNGKTNKHEKKAINVQDLPTPSGNIRNAQLNLNTCKSNSTTQYPLKGSGLTLMAAFYKTFDFKTVRGTSFGVSYSIYNYNPFPGRSWYPGTWDYMRRPAPMPQRYPGIGLPPK